MRKRACPNSTQSDRVGDPVAADDGLHLKLDHLASRFLHDLYELHATLVALSRIGTTLVESVDAADDGLAIERLAGDSKEAVDRLIGLIDDTLHPVIKEVRNV